MFPQQGYQMQAQPMYNMQAMQMGQAPQMQVNTMQMQANKYKTSLCRHFKNGNCSLGSQCHFAHGQSELRSFTDPLPQNLPTIQPKVTGNNYKTVRCKYYDNGFCKNQANCNFAHGDSDTKMGAPVQGGGMIQQLGGGAQMPAQQSNQDPNVQILIMILQNLEQVFPQNQPILQKLNQAQEFARQSQTKEATQIILEIIEAPDRTQQEKQQYQTIYSNAQIYYSTVMAGQPGQQQK